MTSRRDLLIGLAAAAAAGAAWAKTPRNRMSLIGKNKLEAIVPETFGAWRTVPSNALVVPESEDSLASKLYGQTLGRTYVSADGKPMMLLIAYGDTQSDQLQLHRPEVCYPAFGFTITQNALATLPIKPGVAIPARALTAESPARLEQVTYWTRIGEYLPQDGGSQRNAKLMSAFDGLIPDGILVRLSNFETDAGDALKLSQRFASELIQAIAPANRPPLIGTQRSLALLR